MEDQFPRMNYVVGFLFDPTLTKVVLIRKLKPLWQKGLLNGVGGKIGDHQEETAEQAMHREFMEEAGMERLAWKPYLKLQTLRANLTFFSATGNVYQAKTMLDEKIDVYDVNEIMDRCDTLPNIRWCIQMARSQYFGEQAKEFKVEEIMVLGWDEVQSD